MIFSGGIYKLAVLSQRHSDVEKSGGSWQSAKSAGIKRRYYMKNNHPLDAAPGMVYKLKRGEEFGLGWCLNRNPVAAANKSFAVWEVMHWSDLYGLNIRSDWCPTRSCFVHPRRRMQSPIYSPMMICLCLIYRHSNILTGSILINLTQLWKIFK